MTGRQPTGDPWVAGNVGPRRSGAPAVGDAGATSQSPRELGVGEFLDIRSYKGQLRGHHVRYLKERTKQRRKMMKWTLRLASTIVVISTVAMGAYFVSEWQHIAPAVMVAWFSSVVAEVLGLVYIVASYLFPKDDHAVENMIARLDPPEPDASEEDH